MPRGAAIPTGEIAMFKTILVPTDGSAVAALAIGPAIEFAKSQRARIIALSVAEPPPALAVAGAEYALPDPNINDDELLAKARGNLEALVSAAREAEVPCTSVVMVAPRPHVAIVQTAQDQHCELIIMASHGRRGIQRLVMGGQTEKVLLNSTVPVLVYRPQRPA
jgi:nucleotide-binding universal stress UspA family protein